MGGFHIALNYLGLIGKKYLDSGLGDLLIESGVYAAGTTAAVMKGISYNRGVRAHKLVSEAMFRLMWSAFVEWYASADDVSLNDDERVLQCISDSIHALQQDQGNVSETVAQLCDDLRQLSTLFKTFKGNTRAASKTFLFWEQYIEMVNILLQFIKADRSCKLELISVSLSRNDIAFLRHGPAKLCAMVTSVHRRHEHARVLSSKGTRRVSGRKFLC